jgi:hypothetical protein
MRLNNSLSKRFGMSITKGKMTNKGKIDFKATYKKITFVS